jgi:4-amino-4-deoxy-L-arabinose transferase-like glycosyltransferase
MNGCVDVLERRGALLVPLLILAAALAIHAPRLNRPFGPDIASAAASYQILFARHWDEAGFFELRGVPCVGPPAGTVIERHPYLHHPVLSYWLAYGLRSLLGWHEWVFRLLPFLCTLTSALLLGAITRRVLGNFAALLAGWIFLLTPMVFSYGDMPNPEAMVLATLLGGWLLHERIREQPTPGRKCAFFAVAFVGMLVDWQAYFLVLALLAGEALRPQSTRRWRQALSLIPLSVVAVLALACWASCALGSFDALAQHFSEVARTPFSAGAVSFSEFVLMQGRALFATMGWPLVGSAIVVLVSAALGRAAALRLSAAAVMLVPALVSVLLFRRPAFDHPFWWMPATGFFALSGAWLITRLLETRPLFGVLATVVLMGSVSLVALAQQRPLGRPEQPYRDIATLITRFSQPDDIIITPEAFGPALFYTERRLYENQRSIESIRGICEASAPRRVHVVMLLTTALTQRELVAWLDEQGQRTPHPGVLHWTLQR